MQTFKYYTQENGLFKLKIQKTAYFLFGILMVLFGSAAIFALLDKFSEKPIMILVPLFIFAIAILLFLRTTAILLIDRKRALVSWQPFSFKQPKLYYIKDFNGFSTYHQTYLGIKGVSMVDMRFDVNGKEHGVILRQTFMTTKSLQTVVEETEYIMDIDKEHTKRADN